MARAMPSSVVLVAVCVIIAAPAFSATAEISRQEIGQWGDPFTPPHSRTDCVRYASGKWPWGGRGWKTCVGFRTQWQHMEVKAFLVTDGPDNLGNALRNSINACLVTAAAAAGTTVAITSGVAVPAALAAAKVAFGACLTAKVGDVADTYGISMDTQSHWTDWS